LNAIGEIFSSPVWGILLWALFIAVVAYIIYIVVLNKGNFIFKRKSRSLNQDDIDGLAEPFETIDWEKLTQKALQANDLRLAIRYSYMRLLQLMQEKQLIRYRDDKTNFEYSMELAPTLYSQPFRQLSRQYEFAFYGNYIPSEAAYREFEAQFNTVKKQLGTNG
jgi:hypothetical protein